MKPYLWHISSLGLIAALGACASVKSYERIQQPRDQMLRTHINGTIFRVQRTSDLPNALGKADIFGGKVDRGFIELRYIGLAPDGRVILRLTEIDTASNETTMSRYGGGTMNLYSNTTYSPYGSWTTATGVYIPPREGRTEMLPPNTVEFLFDTEENPLVIANTSVTFIDPSPYGTGYVLGRGSPVTAPARLRAVQPSSRPSPASVAEPPTTHRAGNSTGTPSEFHVPISGGQRHVLIKPGMTEQEVAALLGQPQWQARFEETRRWAYGHFSVIFERGSVSRVVFTQP